MSDKPTGVINIHGREYETVALRVKRFREARPDWSVVTEILHRDTDVVIVRAAIGDPNGRTLATGHAEEWRKSSTINRTSAIENAETSAIGRALAALGMGGTEFATANEIETAKRKEKVDSPHQQEDEHPVTPQEVKDALALLTEEAADGFAAVQAAMEKLRAPVQDHLRKREKDALSGIKKTAIKNTAAASKDAA